MDIDRDNTLNILNIIHLNKNLRKSTLLSREIKMIFDEYLSKNLLTNSKKANRIDISYELFQKICVTSVIRGEIRRKFFKIVEKHDDKEPHSICTVMTGE